MKLDKWAYLATILALIPTGYSAYGTWLVLHPPQVAAKGAVQLASPFSGAVASLLVAVGLLVVASSLNFLLIRKHKPTEQAQTTAAQLVASSTTPAAPTTTSPIDVEAFLLHSYVGQLHSEVEKNVRAMVMSRPEPERLGFAIRFIAIGIPTCMYEQIWLTVFRSQLLAMHDLNRRIMRREEVKSYYDAAVIASPQVYARYSFDQWMEYLRTNFLILEHPGNTVEITIRGKDFLKYLLHLGRSADDKKH